MYIQPVLIQTRSCISPFILVLFLFFGCDSALRTNADVDGSENDPAQQNDLIISLILVSGDGQQAVQLSTLDNPIVLEVRNAREEPVAGIEVEFVVEEDHGTLDQKLVTSDASGRIQVLWTLGMGWSHVMTAQIPELDSPAVSLSANALYRYRTPEGTSDGWSVAPVDPESDRGKLLAAGIDAIRSQEYRRIHSLLVIRNGDLLLEEYFPGLTSWGTNVNWSRTLQHEVQSASKSFRSALLGIAIDEGFISGVDQPIFELLPEYDYLFSEDKKAITVEHVLTMSSGLDWNESGAAGGASTNLSTMYSKPYFEWAPYVLRRPLAFTPGTRWVYNTGASIMINKLVEGASGMSMADFVRTYYTSKIESTILPGIGNPLGATTRPRDMAKLGQIFLDDGMWKGNRVFSEDWVTASIKPRFQVNSQSSYGYQWWMRTYQTATRSYSAYLAAGNGGQYVIVIPDLDLVVVSTGGNFGSSEQSRTHEIVQRFVIPAFE